MASNNAVIKPLGQLAAAITRGFNFAFNPPPNSIQGIDPAHWPSALQPVQPIGPKGSEPLGMLMWMGQNLMFTPRPDAEYTAADLKDLSKYPLARICAENVKDQISECAWEIQLKANPGEPKKARAKRAQGDQNLLQLNRFFQRPDREHDWPEFVRPLLEDMLTIDAGSILMQRDKTGAVGALRVLRGETITRYVDDSGYTPLPPNPAYAQSWMGIPRVNLDTTQLVYKPRNIVPRNTLSSQLYGMCYSDDTEILTRDSGWILFRNLKKTDLVATRNAATKTFEWQRPVKYIDQPYSGKMYHFHSLSTDVLVTPKHRMLVSFSAAGGKRNEKIMTAVELATGNNRERKLPLTSVWNGEEVGRIDFPSYRGFEFGIEGDDYCALIGAYLAEGNLRTQGGIEINQLKKSKGFAAYDALLKRINGKSGYNGKTAFVLARRSITEHFRQFGHQHERFIPELIRGASPRQLRIFWDYFMMGDGSSIKRANVSGRGNQPELRERASTTSKLLADHLVEVAQKLGWSASVGISPGGVRELFGKRCYCREHYNINVRYSRNASVTADQIDYDGRVYCVSVPNGIVYVRRNGKPVWSGNSVTEQLADEIKLGALRLVSALAYYTDGSVPGLIQIVPPETSPDLIKETMDWMNSELAGQLAKRRQWRMVQGFVENGQDKIIQTKEPMLWDAFDEAHIRKICFGYGTSPQRLMKMMNRASSAQADTAALKEGVMPFLTWLKSVIDYVIQVGMNLPDYELAFDSLIESDPLKEMQTVTGYFKSGIYTLNKALEELDEEASDDPVADVHGLVTGAGFVPLAQPPQSQGMPGGGPGGAEDSSGEYDAEPPTSPTAFKAAWGQGLQKYSQDQPRDEHGKFIEVGTLKEVKTRVWKGQTVAVQTGISKQNVGKLGEKIVLQYMKQQGYSDARPLNSLQSNFPVDMVQDHAAIEVKSGLVSNNPSAQHWRATIGQPGPTEAAWLANADHEEKAAWNEAKAAQILDRKNQVVKDLSKSLGRKVQAQTVTCIISPDERKVDLFRFKGFHLRIGWNAPETAKAYVGSFRY